MNIGDVQLDDGAVERFERINDGDRMEGATRRIDNQRGSRVAGFMDPVDDFASVLRHFDAPRPWQEGTREAQALRSRGVASEYSSRHV